MASDGPLSGTTMADLQDDATSCDTPLISNTGDRSSHKTPIPIPQHHTRSEPIPHLVNKSMSDILMPCCNPSSPNQSSSSLRFTTVGGYRNNSVSCGRAVDATERERASESLLNPSECPLNLSSSPVSRRFTEPNTLEAYHQVSGGPIDQNTSMPLFRDQTPQNEVTWRREAFSNGIETETRLFLTHDVHKPQTFDQVDRQPLQYQSFRDPNPLHSVITPPHDNLQFSWMQPSSAPANLAEKRLGVSMNLPLASHETQLDTSSRSEPDVEPDDQKISAKVDSWLDSAIELATSALASRSASDSLRILSHALPLPLVPGHSFPAIIEKSRAQLSSDRIIWTSLLHAVPGQFKLEDLPRTPLMTPGQPLGGGEDYFATKVFESAVTTVDYNQADPLAPAAAHALAAPGSIDMAIVERYIPPPTIDELNHLYKPFGRSLLVDRMVEISPNNGCLIFIYPTKNGGQIFANDYLGPVLDPLLRSIVVVNNFSADLSRSLGGLSSHKGLQDFETMRENTERLCHRMSQPNLEIKQRLHGIGSQFRLVFAKKTELALERSVWANWWVKQEKTRIRVTVNSYFRANSKHEAMPHNIIQEVLDGVSSRECSMQPENKIEIAMFVIQRSLN